MTTTEMTEETIRSPRMMLKKKRSLRRRSQRKRAKD
jgi:hypothetical protein